MSEFTKVVSEASSSGRCFARRAHPLDDCHQLKLHETSTYLRNLKIGQSNNREEVQPINQLNTESRAVCTNLKFTVSNNIETNPCDPTPTNNLSNAFTEKTFNSNYRPKF